MKKPSDLFIDGEVFTIYHDHPDDIPSPYVSGARMNLSPYEVEQLINWLKQYQEYIRHWHKRENLLQDD